MFGEGADEGVWEEFVMPPRWHELKDIAEDWGFDIREVDDNGKEIRCYYPYRGLRLDKLNEPID